MPTDCKSSYAVQGNIPAAKSVARALGINGIPDDVLENAQALGRWKSIVDEAEKWSPGRPKDQVTYIASHLAYLQAMHQAPPEAVTEPYRQVPGAPTPPVQGPNSKAKPSASSA